MTSLANPSIPHLCRRLTAAAAALLLIPSAAEPAISTQEALVQIGQTANICALSFDDGPGPFTPRLLSLLRQHGIKATFFLIGDRVRAYPDVARQIAEDGHEIGNHTETHAKLRPLPDEDIRAELVSVQRRLSGIGIRTRLFRPPYGIFNARVADEAAKLGLSVVLWTVDSEDWKRMPNPDRLISPTGHDHPTTGIFLFHDIHESTIKALPSLLKYLEDAGVTFVTVSEFLGDEKPELRPLPKDANLVGPRNPQKNTY